MATSSPLAALTDHPFLSAIPIGSLRRLATHAQRRSYAAGEEIFVEGHVADRFFLIRQGLVRLDLEVPGRGRVQVETVGADSAFGWSWLFAPYQWHLSATAVERTTTLVFDADLLRSVMASDSVVGYELMRRFAAVMFDRLQATRLRLSGDETSIPRVGVSGPWAGRRSTALLPR
jgi:CRP/FNR family cyclic AMP-dependent transcriptional regulator